MDRALIRNHRGFPGDIDRVPRASLRGTALALLALVTLAGCSSRQRLNPFDPENPDTGGRPAGFTAIAGPNSVALSWSAVGANGLLGYHIDRRLEGDTTWVTVFDLLPPSVTRITDFGLRNGVDHHYRLQFVFAGGPNGRPAEDVAAPGPQRPWVTDFDRKVLHRLTPDARRVAATLGSFAGPTHLALDPPTGTVWVCDFYGDRVVVVPGDGRPQRVFENVTGPYAVATDPGTGKAWVADPTNQRLVHLDANGGAALPPTIEGVFDPVWLAVDKRDGSVWVCEGRGNQLRRFDATGAPLSSTTIVSPARVALDSLTGAAWVTAFTEGRVYVVSSNGTIADTTGGFRRPNGIAVDWRRGRIWVADALADEVVALRRDGSVEFRVGALPEVREIALDAYTGDVWATVAGDEAVVRISSNGGSARKCFGLGTPTGIAVDSGVR